MKVVPLKLVLNYAVLQVHDMKTVIALEVLISHIV